MLESFIVSLLELLSSVAPTEEPSSRSPPTVFIVNMEKCSDTASTRPGTADKTVLYVDINRLGAIIRSFQISSCVNQRIL